MRVVVAIASLALICLLLAEFFITFLVPRRVKREPRIARQFTTGMWKPWRAIGTRLSKSGSDTMLGLYGPLVLICLLAVLGAGLILGFAGLQWAHHADLRAGPRGPGVTDDFYFSAASFLSTSTTLYPQDGLSKVLQLAEAGSGYAILFISIGYLPALFQAFSRRETAVSQLDPRAGSPPTAGSLLIRAGEAGGGWEDLDDYLEDWETWAAEVMETQLSYPILGYFRSQHVNQNWIAALTAVVDTCAFSIAYGPPGDGRAAMNTFAIGRHALGDLSLTLRADVSENPPDRLPPADEAELVKRLQAGALDVTAGEEASRHLRELRDGYERYAVAIAERLALDLPNWLPPDDVTDNWRMTMARHRI